MQQLAGSAALIIRRLRQGTRQYLAPDLVDNAADFTPQHLRQRYYTRRRRRGLPYQISPSGISTLSISSRHNA